MCYWRSYLHAVEGGSGGYHPVDVKLGLLADGFSLGTLSRGVQLATKMSYEAATEVFKQFAGWSPSHKTLEEATLGLGTYTEQWRQERPPAQEDGEVLLIQFDGKSPPTARESELEQRRQPNRERRAKELADSPRHRGRHRRWRRGSKRRRKKGEKSKNGRMTTVVVMYTLKKGKGPNGEPVLKGPVNKWVYASFAPKRHAFEVARQEADKRGFSSTSGKRVQIMTDGDEDYQRYIEELFPEAEHSLDVMHMIEYLWKAGACLYRQGSKKLERWIERQKEHLYKGEAEQIVNTLRTRLEGKLSKSKKKRLQGIIDYMSKRLHMMNYDELADDDLELASGIVEGAVRYVVSQRFDEGGMRWIPERAEALLQLRCIEINGEWEQFISFVRERIRRKKSQSRRLLRLR